MRYRRMLTAEGTDKEVKEYVKERFRSALQLMRNIAQRKSTILRTCEVIVRRQQEFLDQGIEALRPMMIKEVAEEIGVHPSTVSRAVANKYAHTPQGVIELRFFFSEGSNGPEGAPWPSIARICIFHRRIKGDGGTGEAVAGCPLPVVSWTAFPQGLKPRCFCVT
jgi:RNA polymerase sigma-54 factor